MLGGRKITAETLEGSVAKCCLQRGILLTLLCYLFVDKLIRGLDGNGFYTVGYLISLSVENSQRL
jgi:hypothetical protein